MMPTISDMFASDVARMQRAQARGDKVSLLLIHRKIIRKYSCHISPWARIASTATFPHPTGIVIGDGAVIGEGCTVYQHVTMGRLRKDVAEYPIPDEGRVLYAGSCVLGGARLGAGTVVGANAVVLGGSYGVGSTLVGSPARNARGVAHPPRPLVFRPALHTAGKAA